MTARDAATMAEILGLFHLAPRTAVVPWLEQHIVLPAKMAPNSAGPFRTGLRPYQRPILECWNPDSGVQHCGVSAGVQIAKTTILALGLSYRICNSPLPALIVGSSKDWTKTEISEKRLQPLINENPILESRKPGNSDNFRAMAMDMDGGMINLVGGNSPGALSGGSYGIVAIDEAAKLIHQGSDQAPEAHPFHLAAKRTDGFGALAFHYRSSTPNTPNHPFWQYILLGDQTRFWVSCPHCKGEFYLDFVNRPEDREEYASNTGIDISSDYLSLTWQDARDGKGNWDETKVRETVRYICPHNGCEIDETHKQPMIETCQEHRHNTLAAKSRRSFIIPSFYSPTISFGTMAWAYLEARRDFFGLQDYFNSRLAKPWQQYDVSLKLADIERCQRDYVRGTVPFKPRLMFLAADPGQLLTHWEVVAIDDNGGLWIIDWGTVLSSSELINPEFLKARIYPIAGTTQKAYPLRGFVDSGWLTETQFDVCQASNGFLWPTRGSDAKHGGVSETRAASRPNLKLITYPDKQAKDELYDARLAKARNGGIHFPADADAALKLGHANQKRDATGVWARVPDDHFGDCTKLSMIGLWLARSAGIL
jgi:phage terminase large subunit GpA-like protein